MKIPRPFKGAIALALLGGAVEASPIYRAVPVGWEVGSASSSQDSDNDVLTLYRGDEQMAYRFVTTSTHSIGAAGYDKLRKIFPDTSYQPNSRFSPWWSITTRYTFDSMDDQGHVVARVSTLDNRFDNALYNHSLKVFKLDDAGGFDELLSVQLDSTNFPMGYVAGMSINSYGKFVYKTSDGIHLFDMNTRELTKLDPVNAAGEPVDILTISWFDDLGRIFAQEKRPGPELSFRPVMLLPEGVPLVPLPVPEPSTAWLFGLAAGGVLLQRRHARASR